MSLEQTPDEEREMKPEGGETPSTEGAALPVRPRRGLLGLIALALGAAALGLLRLPAQHSFGWDEAMHAALPAAGMVLAVDEGRGEDFARVLLDCEQYPFVFPAILAATQMAGGVDEDVARGTTVALFALAVFFLCLLAGELARPRGRGAAQGAALLAAFLALESPMAQAFARTLFLEVPFLCVSAAALLAWVKRRGGAARDLLAGALLTAAFFTKFNYGALFVAGLAADEFVSLLLAAHRRELRPRLLRTARTAAPLIVACFWWFVLPFPGGAEHAESHRFAFAGFLGGNLELAATGPGRKALHLVTYLVPSPAQALLVLIGLLAALPAVVRDERARAVGWTFLALALPTALHPFHLERFWLPAGLGLWSLSALGWMTLVGLGPARRVGLRGALLGGLLLATMWGAPGQSLWLARVLGQVPDDPAVEEAALEVFRGWNGPMGGRVVPTAGLLRSEAAELLDRVAEEVGPDERYGWLGLSSEVSPGFLALGLYERGGSAARLLRESETSIDIVPTPGAPEPDWSTDRLREWAGAFDVVFFTDPPDVKDRADRRGVKERWHRPLVQNLGMAPQRLGVLQIVRGGGDVLDVGLFACRRLR